MGAGGWLWLLGMLIGYGLFMLNHPLRAEFAAGFRHARTHSWLALSLAGFLVFDVLWQFWQGVSPIQGNASPTVGWGTALSWLSILVAELRALFWFLVPLNAAFLLGAPLAAAFSGFWVGRLWNALPPSHRWIFFTMIGLLALTLWWWWQSILELLGVPFSIVPENGPIRPVLWASAEIAWAVFFAVFVQLVLLLNAYRTHTSKIGRSPARDTIGWTIKCVPFTIAVPLIVLSGVILHGIAIHFLDPLGQTIWTAVNLTILISLSAAPVSLLLLREVKWIEAIRASLAFLKRSAWSYAWFLFIVLVHFAALHSVERYLLNLPWIQGSHILTWHLVAAFIRAGLVAWFLHAFCIFFCVDVQGRTTKAGPSRPRKKAMNLRKLQVRR